MSMKTTVMGPRGLQKSPGWFSWRHATPEQHHAARASYLSQHGPAARRHRAAEREADTLRVMYEQNVSRAEAQRVAKASRAMLAAKAARQAVAR